MDVQVSTAAVPDQDLSVTLHMTPDLSATLRRFSGALDVARSFIIDGPEMAQAANNELKATKERVAKLRELKSGFVAPAKQIIANAEALFDGPINDNLAAEAHYKRLLLDFAQEQERIAAEERRRAEEEARKARQEAEAKAAAERARAEEQRKEQERIACEAEERRLAAEREGNARAAAKAAAEAAAATEKASAVVENAEAKATEALLAAAAAPTAVVDVPTKLAGFSMRDNWGAELKTGVTEAQAVAEIAKAIAAGRSDLVAMLKLDMSAAGKLAKALKDAFNVPGLVAKNTPVAASRR